MTSGASGTTGTVGAAALGAGVSGTGRLTTGGVASPARGTMGGGPDGEELQAVSSPTLTIEAHFARVMASWEEI
jgi:hypothetical protein